MAQILPDLEALRALWYVTMRYAVVVSEAQDPKLPPPTPGVPQADGAQAANVTIPLAHFAHLDRLATAGLLSAGFVHNLANLLTPIAAGAEVTLRSDDPDAHRRALVHAAEYAAQATELTRAYLDFVRRDQIERVDVPVIPIVQRAIALLQQEATRRGVALVQHFDCDHKANVDRTRILQIVLNLLSNAIRAAQSGGFVVTVRIKGQKDRVVVEIEDNGPGIDPEIVAHLFEPFVHGGASDGRSEDEERRTGLGLFITRQLAEEQDAKIHFQTEPGSGTIFHVALRESRAVAREKAKAATETGDARGAR